MAPHLTRTAQYFGAGAHLIKSLLTANTKYALYVCIRNIKIIIKNFHKGQRNRARD